MGDSRVETYEHIHKVQKQLMRAVQILTARLVNHDATKLVSPEVEAFDSVTGTLGEVTYGSPEYEALRAKIAPALEHHYQYNSHHPEHYPDGVRDMDLIDLLELICDWMAATERTNNGDIMRSIKMNQQRFGFSDELAQILRNTVDQLKTGRMQLPY